MGTVCGLQTREAPRDRPRGSARSEDRAPDADGRGTLGGMALQVVPMLPCADIDEIEAFFVPLGFEVTYRQVRPNPYLALEGHGFPVHYYGMPAHRAEDSHSTFGVAVPDPGPLFEASAAGLRAQFGKLPVVLGGAVRRAAPDDPALADARAFLDELTERLA